MDFKAIKNKSDGGVPLVLKHPGSGEATDVILHLAGADSQQYRKVTQMQRERRLNESSRPGKVSVPELEKETTEALAACILGWENVSYEGAELPCNFENAMMLMESQLWMRDQIAEFVTNRSNYYRD